MRRNFTGFGIRFPAQDVSAVRLRVIPHGDTTAFRNFRNAVFYFGTVTKGLMTLKSESAIVASAEDMIAARPTRVLVYSARTLNAIHQSRVTLSLRQERLRAACCPR